MKRAPEYDNVICRCGHPGRAHDAGECWWDTVLDIDTEGDTDSQCQCGWWEPRMSAGGGVR